MISKPIEINPGQKKVVEVDYRNDGTIPAYKAEVRITMASPFSSTDNVAYLGDIKPGESGRALFDLSASGDAPEKTYGLDSEVRYRDLQDNSQTSDTVKVPVIVTQQVGVTTIFTGPIAIVVFLVIIGGIGYYLLGVRRKVPVS